MRHVKTPLVQGSWSLKEDWRVQRLASFFQGRRRAERRPPVAQEFLLSPWAPPGYSCGAIALIPSAQLEPYHATALRASKNTPGPQPALKR
jgi:hypothetical protein